MKDKIWPEQNWKFKNYQDEEEDSYIFAIDESN